MNRIFLYRMLVVAGLARKLPWLTCSQVSSACCFSYAPVESQCHYVVKAEFDGRQYGDDYLVLKKGDTVMVSWLSLGFASRH